MPLRRLFALRSILACRTVKVTSNDKTGLLVCFVNIENNYVLLLSRWLLYDSLHLNEHHAIPSVNMRVAILIMLSL